MDLHLSQTTIGLTLNADEFELPMDLHLSQTQKEDILRWIQFELLLRRLNIEDFYINLR